MWHKISVLTQAIMYLQDTDKQPYISKKPKHTPIKRYSSHEKKNSHKLMGNFKEEIRKIVMRHKLVSVAKCLKNMDLKLELTV